MTIPELNFPVDVFDERQCLTGEGPVWDEQGMRVVWVDVLGSRVLWKSYVDSSIGEIQTPSHVGAVLPLEGPLWLAFLQDGVYRLGLKEANFELVEHFPDLSASLPDRAPPMRANDAKVGPSGAAYIGVMAYDTQRFPHSGAVFRLSESGFSLAIPNTTLSNGIDWSPDGRTMYHIDSAHGTVEAFDYESKPILETRRVIARIEPVMGVPDGMSIDIEGNLWIGLWDGRGLLGMHPSGQIFGRLPLPCQHVTSCAFVGTDLRRLIVTTASYGQDPGDLSGATFIVDMPTRGRPQRCADLTV
jgi:sugar lactone lactonase YvrE